MFTVLELFHSIGLIMFSFVKEVTEEEIQKNIDFLMRYEWFQDLITNREYEELIYEDHHVRFVIGKMNRDKMHSDSYRNKWRNRIERLLVKMKSN